MVNQKVEQLKLPKFLRILILFDHPAGHCPCQSSLSRLTDHLVQIEQKAVVGLSADDRQMDTC